MDTNGKTGIEISPGISEAQKVTAKVLHALHLEWFGALVGDILKDTTMGITVDGQRREEPWHGTHFFECAPGTHELKLDWNTHSFMGGRCLAPLKCEITVEPDRVTEVVYTIQQLPTHGLPCASVEIKGTRASG
jgi:hypothetical protein